MPQVTDGNPRQHRRASEAGTVTETLASVPGSFLERYHHFGITNTAAMLVVQIAHIQQQAGESIPITAPELGERLGITPTAVRTHLRALENHGLKRERLYGNVNSYDLGPLLAKVGKINTVVSLTGQQIGVNRERLLPGFEAPEASDRANIPNHSQALPGMVIMGGTARGGSSGRATGYYRIPKGSPSGEPT